MSLFSRVCVLCVTLFLSACGEDDLQFQILFNEIDGLKTGAPLVHKDNAIGHVEDIVYSEENGFYVHALVDEMHRPLATQSALFYVRTSSDSDQAELEMISSAEPDAIPIAEHQVIKGSSRLGGMSKKFQNQLGGVLQAFSEGIKQSWNGLTEQSVDDQMSYLDEEMERLASQLKDLGETARKQFEQDVMPRLKQQLESLKERLKGSDREDEIEPIEKKFDQLNELIEA